MPYGILPSILWSPRAAPWSFDFLLVPGLFFEPVSSSEIELGVDDDANRFCGLYLWISHELSGGAEADGSGSDGGELYEAGRKRRL